MDLGSFLPKKKQPLPKNAPKPRSRMKIELNPNGLLKSVVKRKKRMKNILKAIEKSEKT